MNFGVYQCLLFEWIILSHAIASECLSCLSILSLASLNQETSKHWSTRYEQVFFRPFESARVLKLVLELAVL